MKDDIATIGDDVVYTGETKYAADSVTVRLMHKYLEVGVIYTVKVINQRYGDEYNPHYKFEGIPTYIFPYKKFYKIIQIVFGTKV